MKFRIWNGSVRTPLIGAKHSTNRGLAQTQLQSEPIDYMIKHMKHLQFIGLMACAAFFVGCETTSTTGNPSGTGNQEAKRLAAIEQEKQHEQEMDEGQRNLWNAQHDIMTRDSNPATRYY